MFTHINHLYGDIRVFCVIFFVVLSFSFRDSLLYHRSNFLIATTAFVVFEFVTWII